jgi:hypothetical protein
VTRFAILLAAFSTAANAPQLPDFHNIAAEAGLVHTFPNGGTQSKKYIIETTGSGAAFIDYNNDGLLDIFVLSGRGGTNRLYRNDGNGHFTDVTTETGLTSDGWSQGVCAGDFDNDGFTDLLVTSWGGLALYRNIEGRRFENITKKARLDQGRARYNTGCAFLDYDNDGRLDIFVADYLKFDFATTPKPGENPYCWYRDLVSDASGISKPDQSYCLSVLTGDFNQDGRTDIFVACDQTPSLLYINRGDGTFSEEALLRGAAFDENGKAMSGMGAASADYDGDGKPDIFRSNFSDERETLYRNRGAAEFDDVTVAAGMAHNTRFVGWGCGFLDFDNNGWKDLFLANGHVFPEVDRLKIDIHYKDRAILYRNNGNGTFADISERAGPGILERHAARGVAFGDYDNDGSVEVLINNQNEPPSLLKSARKPSGNWVILKLEGTISNRSAIGARVRLTAGGHTQVDEVRSGGSYLSQNDLRLHFGVGTPVKIDKIAIDWPGGAHQLEENAGVNRILTIREPRQ